MATKPSPKPNKNAMGPMKKLPAKANVQVNGTNAKPKRAIEKLIGLNGIKAKYFDAKAAVEKNPTDAKAKRQLIDRSRTNARANAIVNRNQAAKMAKGPFEKYYNQNRTKNK